jgi:hypothetical protein
MSESHSLQPLTAHEPGRQNPRRTRKHPGRSADTAHEPAACFSAKDAVARADRYLRERDAVILEHRHLLDTVNDIKGVAERFSTGGGADAGFTYAPPPDPFTAELLKRDALITQWSLAYRDAVVLHNTERAKDAFELCAARNKLYAAHGKIDALSAQLLSSISSDAASGPSSSIGSATSPEGITSAALLQQLTKPFKGTYLSQTDIHTLLSHSSDSEDGDRAGL